MVVPYLTMIDGRLMRAHVEEVVFSSMIGTFPPYIPVKCSIDVQDTATMGMHRVSISVSGTDS